MIISLLKKYQCDFYPILGKSFQKEDFCKIDLNVNASDLDLNAIQTYDGLDLYIQNELKKKGAKVGIGGYLEKRVLYQQSNKYKSEAENRNIHLGVDWWSEVGTEIYSPLDGKVHSFQYNDLFLDYGATIILEHELEGIVFYSLYGHLNFASLENLEKGMLIKKGEFFTSVGNRHENGGWVPHLHFQIIKDMMGKEGDFPGVTSDKYLSEFSKNCPDPNVFFVY
ncbi:peptidoglycan DD-metalloendopeptidase family protein [bacterium]|nr:peptidoglycan DD-metalloendopeptidase family protein [Saprospiraceae bacterium]MDC3253333.1 peptidoglycan DD-metalloendopeptidase family protein [bacterium]MDG1432376.1 peptidoglycan DD-metalloendopeptidase family protein [Saprospiraceae bacterium]